jgi:hypothetical protein
MGSVKLAFTHFFPGISTPHHQHDHWDAVLLRARGERPAGRRAADKRDERAPFSLPVPPALPTER